MRTDEKNLRARPPGVVSGLPNMTPIFSRSWLMKMQVVFDFEREPASLRKAWLMRRACRPTVVSPISPSISARGTSAATESTTTHVDGAGAHEHVADLERLLAGVGLGDEHLVDVDADARGIAGVEGVLGVDERDDAAHGLGLSQDLERERGLAGGLGAVDLDDAAAGNASDAQRGIKGERARGDGLDVDARVRPSPNLMMEPLPNFLIISSSVALRTFSRSSPVVAGRISLDVPLVLAMCAPLLSCCLDVRRTPVLSQHPWAHLRLEDLRLADTWHTANFRPAYRTLSVTGAKQSQRNVKQG